MMNEDFEGELYQDDPFAFSDPYETMFAGDLYRFEDLNSTSDYDDELGPRFPDELDEAYGIKDGNFVSDTAAYAGMRWDEFEMMKASDL